jgi:hypothetical protein
VRISFHSWDVQFNSHTSEAEMKARLGRSGQPFDVLDVSGGYPRQFYSLELQPQFAGSKESSARIGLCSSRTGIEPQLLCDCVLNVVYVGVDSSLCVLDLKNQQTKRLELGAPFYWMARLTTHNATLVVYETGLLSLIPGGEIVWKHETHDVIATVALSSHDALQVALLEGGTAVVDLVSGRVAQTLDGK